MSAVSGEAPRNALDRYKRQLGLLGIDGQEKLASSTVVVAGLGGLGSIVSLYLAAAGVGRLRIVDPDIVEIHNLNRQLLYSEADLGLPKAYLAARRLRELRPDLKVEPLMAAVSEDNAGEIVRGSDLVVDALDNWEARLALADAAWQEGIRLVHAAVDRYYGQITTIHRDRTICLHCIAPASPQRRCTQVIGPAVGVVASLEAMEAIKVLTGIGEPLYNKLLVVDAITPSIDVIKLTPIPCEECKQRLADAGNS